LLATTESVLDPVYGCVQIKLGVGSQKWLATLVDTGQVADRGVPGWNLDVSGGELPKQDLSRSIHRFFAQASMNKFKYG
jgi:hypothetical protein